MSVNKVILIGRLGANPEIRHTQGGGAVGSFTLATNESWTDKNGQKQDRTEWHKIVVWGKLAELCGQYLSKGRQCFLEGKLQTRQWQDKEGQTRYTTEVVASTVQFLGGANERTGERTSGGYTGGGYANDRGAALNQSAPFGGGMGAAPTADEPSQVRMEEPSFSDEDIPF